MLGFFVVYSVPWRLKIVAVGVSSETVAVWEGRFCSCSCASLDTSLHGCSVDERVKMICLHRLAACMLRCVPLHCVLMCELLKGFFLKADMDGSC